MRSERDEMDINVPQARHAKPVTHPDSSPPSQDLQARGFSRRTKKYLASNKDLIVVTLALLGAFSGIVGTVRSFLPHTTLPLSKQALLDQAEGWAMTYTANFTKGFSGNWSSIYDRQPSTQVGSFEGSMQIYVHTYSQGGYSFFRDNEASATLPSGDYYLSASNLSEPPGCEYGLLFGIDTALRFGWVYIDTTGKSPAYALGVSLGNAAHDNLTVALPERKIGQVDSLGILRYGSQYIVAINGKAVAEVSAAKLSRLAKGPLAGSDLGVGTYTCPKTQATYSFRAISLQVPTDLTGPIGNIEAEELARTAR